MNDIKTWQWKWLYEHDIDILKNENYWHWWNNNYMNLIMTYEWMKWMMIWKMKMKIEWK